MTDRTTKALLAAIALGLWLNLVQTWATPVAAQPLNPAIDDILRHVRQIANGTCVNQTICQ